MKLTREATVKAELQGVMLGNSLRTPLEVDDEECMVDVVEALCADLLNYTMAIKETLKEGRSVTIEIYADLD